MTTGERIKEARKQAGLTQKELGDRLGLSYQAIAQWENDLRKPKRETLLKIADAIGIHVAQLLPEEERKMEIELQLACENKEYGKIEQLLGMPQGSIQPLSVDEVHASKQEEQRLKQRLLLSFNKLTMQGKRIAVERIDELTQIKKYQAAPEE